MLDFDRNHDKPCTKCGAEMHWLEVFPNEVCVDCHSKAWDAGTVQVDTAFIQTMGQDA